jgi:hypothetical protein
MENNMNCALITRVLLSSGKWIRPGEMMSAEEARTLMILRTMDKMSMLGKSPILGEIDYL